MRRNLVLAFFVCAFLVSLSVFAECLAQGDDPGSAVGNVTVNISGEVICPDCRGSDEITVNAKASPGPAYLPIASVNIAGPGEYILRVSPNTGPVYLSATGNSSMGFTSSSLRMGAYLMNPLIVGSSDINDINMIVNEFPPSAAMSTYQGPTVNISGRLVYPGFEEGQKINIIARTAPRDKLGKLVNSLLVSGPGEYSLKVPRGSGDIYIFAMVSYPGRDLPPLMLEYNQGGAIRAENTDIAGVDITE
ncbi:MAG: hypothetical protein WC301_05525 [Candidatus Omnitrophota bacterium]